MRVDCGVGGPVLNIIYIRVDSKVRLVTSCLLSYISYEYDYVLAGAVSVVHAVVPLPNIFS